jgi:hypothetical protein
MYREEDFIYLALFRLFFLSFSFLVSYSLELRTILNFIITLNIKNITLLYPMYLISCSLFTHLFNLYLSNYLHVVLGRSKS